MYVSMKDKNPFNQSYTRIKSTLLHQCHHLIIVEKWLNFKNELDRICFFFFVRGGAFREAFTLKSGPETSLACRPLALACRLLA